MPPAMPCMQLDVRVVAGGQLLVHAAAVGISRSDAPEQLAEGTAVDAEIELVANQITAKGSEIRGMKAAGSPKSAVQAEVALLLQLKARYMELSGTEWLPQPATRSQAFVFDQV